MNILYITKLSGNMWAGPNNSVPAQILAQSKYDNVFWYNLNEVSKEEWRALEYYHNLNDYPDKTLKDLPEPFNKPDLIIFQGVYEFPFHGIIYEVWKKKTPYIIVPRSALTAKAQLNKPLKKKLGNLLFFNKFASKATAIHYLTEKEMMDSGKWNDKDFIIPNGIKVKSVNKKLPDSNDLIGIYIGRIDIYQKGLDLLVEACVKLSTELRSANCKIELYGPDRNDSKLKLRKVIRENSVDDIILIKDAVFDKEKEKIQLEADFFVMTSRFEGHPMGLIEALSYGLPALVTTGSNMAEEINEAKAGWTAEADLNSIITAFKTLVKEKESFLEKGQNALNLSKKFDWGYLAKSSHVEYKKLLNS